MSDQTYESSPREVVQENDLHLETSSSPMQETVRKVENIALILEHPLNIIVE